jgi:AcrR family transcriptional regulator
MANKEIDYSKFSPEQLTAARLLADPDTRLTVKEIAKQSGVSDRTIYRWKEDREFIALVNDLADRYMDSFLSEVYRQLQKGVKRGNTRAIEMALKRQQKLVEVRKVEGEVQHTVAIEGKTNDQLLAEIEELERRQRIEMGEVIEVTPEKNEEDGV